MSSTQQTTGVQERCDNNAYEVFFFGNQDYLPF